MFVIVWEFYLWDLCVGYVGCIIVLCGWEFVCYVGLLFSYFDEDDLVVLVDVVCEGGLSVGCWYYLGGNGVLLYGFDDFFVVVIGVFIGGGVFVLFEFGVGCWCGYLWVLFDFVD